MSSGPAASGLVNGENKKEKVRGYVLGYGNRKDDERSGGAAGGTLSTAISAATTPASLLAITDCSLQADAACAASGGSLFPSPPPASPSSSPRAPAPCFADIRSRVAAANAAAENVTSSVNVTVPSATSGTGISGVTVGTAAAAAGTAVSSAVSRAQQRAEAQDEQALAGSSVVVVVSGLGCVAAASAELAIDGQLLESVEFEEAAGTSSYSSTSTSSSNSSSSDREIGGGDRRTVDSPAAAAATTSKRLLLGGVAGAGWRGGIAGGRTLGGVGVCCSGDDDTSEEIETTEFGGSECRPQPAHSASNLEDHRGEAGARVHASPSYRDNMVAAMNEHLSTSSATSGARSSAAASASTATAGNIVLTNAAAGNSCSRGADFQSAEDDGKPAGILSFPCDFDHMYASMTDGGAPASAATATSALGVSPLRGNEPRQNDLTEVKHLKELLLLHLDLIQQQSEQIVTKDKLLAALRQENETLKLRLERMDRRVNLQKLRSESSENSVTSEHIGACSPTNVNSTSAPSTSEVHTRIQPENNNSQFNESFKIRLNTSGGITTVKQETNDNQTKQEAKLETSSESRIEWEEKKKRKSDPTPLTGGSKRKRGVSCSSNVSNDASSALQDKTHESNKKAEKKGKLLHKKETYLTTKEHYYTAVGDPSYTLSLKESNPAEAGTSLEVPNWRVKIYTSCYTMEGTENLDDEIFNKRHLKLENDERRRKRWDVQRIREQRHIEKLKQRQERQNHQATCYNTNHSGPCPSTVEEEAVMTLWPEIDQIQSVQVDSQLPVTAFGAPIPSFTPSEFTLPWSNTTRSNSRRPKRSTGRRKATRR